MSAFKPAYLIHGDDHGRIGERRSRLRRLAEREGGASGVEVLEGQGATPQAAAEAIGTLTFALGRRFVIVDGVERWTDRQVEQSLAGALADPPQDMTVAFFAREEGKAKAPPALHGAVRAAGGEIREEALLRPAQLPRWAGEQAARLGLDLDRPAAQALVAYVGERQQRLLRELEKLALALGSPSQGAGGAGGPGVPVTVEQIEESVASSAQRRVWTLADAVVARDPGHALRTFLALRAQGERLSGLLYWIAQRLRQALDVAERLDRGESEASIRRSLRMPPKAAERLVADARANDRDGLRRALEAVAQLEVNSRGGAAVEEDTAAVRTFQEIAE